MKNSILLLTFLAGCSAGIQPSWDGGTTPDAASDGMVPCPATLAECEAILLCTAVCHYDGGALVDADPPQDAGFGVDAGDVDAGEPDAGPTGCTSSTACDDGDPCTVDVCAAGACTHGASDACAGSFTFPEASATRTDTRVLAAAPYWTTVGDYEEKVVSLAAVPYATHLDISDVGFIGGGCATPGTFRVLLNGVEVGNFAGDSLLPSPVHFDFPAIAGPGYVVRLEQTSASSGNCLLRAGSGTSTTTLRAP